MERVGLIGREETVAGALVEHHILRVKFVSFSQVSSTLMILWPDFRNSSMVVAYCCRSTKQRSLLIWVGFRLFRRYLMPRSLLMIALIFGLDTLSLLMSRTLLCTRLALVIAL